MSTKDTTTNPRTTKGKSHQADESTPNEKENMNKPSKNYNALAQLAAFSVGAECDAEHLSTEELNARLSDQGIDLLQLEAATLRKVRRLKNEMNASMVSKE